jgi:hypothetical protein
MVNQGNENILLYSIVLVMLSCLSYAQVGIGTSSPEPSAALDIHDTNKGLLPPRMSEADRDAIIGPAAGLMLWCNNCGNGGEMQVFNGADWTNLIGAAAAPRPILVGDYFQGGVVFYIFQNGDPGYVVGETHGLIAATVDVFINWFSALTTTFAQGLGIGEGQTNTTTIINTLGTSTTYAATYCNAYSVSVAGVTYDDWFLPSNDELVQMYLNKAMIDSTSLANGGSLFKNNFYWSSSEYSIGTGDAWGINFSNGGQSRVQKTNARDVRPIRAF